jgi:hypothetical protein
MSTVVQCPECGGHIQAPAGAAGRKLRCPLCKEIFQLGADGTPHRATAHSAAAEPPRTPSREDRWPRERDEEEAPSPRRRDRERERPRDRDDEEPTSFRRRDAEDDLRPFRPKRKLRRSRAGGSAIPPWLMLTLGGVLVAGLVGGGIWAIVAFRGGDDFAGEWRDFSPPGGGFTISMPGEPKEQSEVVPPNMMLRLYVVEKRSWEFGVGYLTLPPVALVGVPRGEIIREFRKGILEEFRRAKILREESISLDGIPGEEFEVEVPRQGRGIIRLYIAGSRLYMLAVSAKRSFSKDSANAKKFLDSFKFQLSAPVQEKPEKPEKPRPKPKPNEPDPAPYKDRVVLRSLDTVIGDPIFSRDGKSFFIMQRSGQLSRYDADSLEVTNGHVLGSVAHFAQSAEGLVVSSPTGEVHVVDPASLKSIRDFKILDLRLLAAAPASSRILAVVGAQGVSEELLVIDAADGKSLRRYAARDLRHFSGSRLHTLSPDGKFLFCQGGLEALVRYRIDGDEVKFDQISARIAQGGGVRIDFSPDSRYVCLVSKAGVYGERGYVSYVYEVEHLGTPAIKIHSGSFPSALGIDPVGGFVYAQNHDFSLIFFKMSGEKVAERNLAEDKTTGFFVNPLGKRFLLRTEGQLLLVELEEK